MGVGDWLVGWLWFNGPLRQYFMLYRAGEKGKKGSMRVKISKQPPPASTASPCPTVIQIVGRPALEVYPAPSHHPTTHFDLYLTPMIFTFNIREKMFQMILLLEVVVVVALLFYVHGKHLRCRDGQLT